MSNLIHGNCIDELKRMATDSADLAVTSPPYNMNLRIRAGKYCSRQLVKEISTKYEGYDDNLSMQHYLDFNRQIIDGLLRVAGLVFYNVQILTGNKPALFKLMGEYSEQIKELIVWDKQTAQPAIHAGVMNSQFELILVLERRPEQAMSRCFKQAAFDRGTLSNLWNIKRGKKVSASHGAVFPEELATTIIENFSEKGDHVIDPMMGTGTAGVCAKELGRSFTGIEIGQQYYEDACERIGNAPDRTKAHQS